MESPMLSRDTLMHLCTVCMYCNRQRCRQGYWSAANPHRQEPTSHGICPACFRGAIEDLKGQIAHELKGHSHNLKGKLSRLA